MTPHVGPSSRPTGRSACIPGLLVAALLLAGCGDEPTSPLARSGITSTWQGSVTVTAATVSRAARGAAVGNQETVLLDVRTAGNQVDASLVLQWPGLASPFPVLLSGTSTSSALDLTTTGGGDSIALALAPFGPTRLEGTLTGRLGGQDIAGTLVLDRIPEADLQAQIFLDLPQAAALSMAVHDDTLWLSTSGDDHFLLVTLGGNLVDQVAVEYLPGTFWTSSVLASGGGKLWGHIPSGTGSGPSVSRVLPFRREGLLPGDFLLGHISSGLAHDGTHLWSLDNEAHKLYRVTEAGVVVDSVAVANPDLYQLAWDGAHFWSMGWYLPLLWKIEPDGDVVGVFRLTSSLTGQFAAGVASDGQYVYAARGNLGTTRIVRLTPASVVP